MARLSLSEIAEQLELTIERAEKDLKNYAPGVDPIAMKDLNGRYILLDSYVALAQIRVLERVEILGEQHYGTAHEEQDPRTLRARTQA